MHKILISPPLAACVLVTALAPYVIDKVPDWLWIIQVLIQV